MTRIYTCNWQDCNKGYETLNHLNTHVKIQSHGLKRTAKGHNPSYLPLFGRPFCPLVPRLMLVTEFEEIRKNWKKRLQAEGANRPPQAKTAPACPEDGSSSSWDSTLTRQLLPSQPANFGLSDAGGLGL